MRFVLCSPIMGPRARSVKRGLGSAYSDGLSDRDIDEGSERPRLSWLRSGAPVAQKVVHRLLERNQGGPPELGSNALRISQQHGQVARPEPFRIHRHFDWNPRPAEQQV